MREAQSKPQRQSQRRRPQSQRRRHTCSSRRHTCSVKGAHIYPHTAILHMALVAALCSCTDVALVVDDKYLSSSYYYI
jgi:hypothetical protein